MPADGSITARFIPQVSSQFSKMGLMMRDTLAAESPEVALLIAPARPGWNVTMLTRGATGTAAVVTGASANLEAPYGRLMVPFWLRLERSGSRITGSVSADGQAWTKVADTATTLKAPTLVGLSVCSALPKVTTTVMFDRVAIFQPRAKNSRRP
jgi:hypothetical protein